MNPLQDLIRRRMAEQQWSFADVARRGGLPRSTVHHLANNERPSRPPHPQTLTRLAAGLELPPEHIRAAAAQAADHDDPAPELAQLTADLGRLAPEDLSRVAAFVRALLDESGRHRP